jgi:hypothetical protein
MPEKVAYCLQKRRYAQISVKVAPFIIEETVGNGEDGGD